MIEPGELRFLTVVLNSPSISAAARTLHVTQSAVSQRIAKIEKRIGVLLVDRSGRSPILTDEGRLVANGADGILVQLAGLNEQISRRRESIRGDLRVIAPLGFGRLHVAPIVAEFRRMHPEVHVDLRLSDRLGRHPEDSFDVMIFVGELPETNLVKRKLASNRRIACASPEFMSKVVHPRSPEELSQLDFIALYEDDSDGCAWRFTGPDGSSRVNLEPSFSSNDGEVTLAWALKGAGFIIRSEWILSEHLRDGRLVRLIPDYSLPEADVVALFADRNLRARRVQAFGDFIGRHLANAPWASDVVSPLQVQKRLG